MEIKGDDDLVEHITDFYIEVLKPLHVTSTKLVGLECNQLYKDDWFFTKDFSFEEIIEVGVNAADEVRWRTA